MKQLNFAPHYEPYVASGDKRLTVRAGNRQELAPGNAVEVTFGWDKRDAWFYGHGYIREARHCRLGDLSDDDLDGESPDCRTVESLKLVLGNIYQRPFRDEDDVWLIRFELE